MINLDGMQSTLQANAIGISAYLVNGMYLSYFMNERILTEI